MCCRQHGQERRGCNFHNYTRRQGGCGQVALLRYEETGLSVGGQVTEQELTPEDWGEITSSIAFRRSLLGRLCDSHLLSLTNAVLWLWLYFLLFFLFSRNSSHDAIFITTRVDFPRNGSDRIRITCGSVLSVVIYRNAANNLRIFIKYLNSAALHKATLTNYFLRVSQWWSPALRPSLY